MSAAAGSDRVVLEIAGAQVPVTLDDAKAIKIALLQALKASDAVDRDYLITWTENMQPAIEEGVIRIGAWALQAKGAELVLRYRMPSGPDGMRAYLASVANEGGKWTVKNIRKEWFRPRR